MWQTAAKGHWQNGIWHGSEWSKSASLNSSTQKKLHPLTFIDACWVQRMDVSTGRQWVVHFSSSKSNIKDKPHARQPCTALTPQNEECFDLPIHANQQITRRELCISFNALEIIVTMVEYCKAWARQVPQILTQEQKEHHMQVCHDLLNQYQAEGDIFHSLIITRDETCCYCYELDVKWQDMNSPAKKKYKSTCSPPQVKWCAVSFGVGNGWSFWVSWNPNRPSILIATSQQWLSWRLKHPESGQLRRQPFPCNTITPGTIPIWRPWSTFPVLAGLSYHTHHVVWIRAFWFPFLCTNERWAAWTTFS